MMILPGNSALAARTKSGSFTAYGVDIGAYYTFQEEFGLQLGAEIGQLSWEGEYNIANYNTLTLRTSYF